MKNFFFVVIILVSATSLSIAQDPWKVVWRMTESPYLTLQDMSEMGMVKAGFDTDKDGWGEFICTWTDLDTNAILMYEATGNDTYKLVWSWVYPISANTYAGIAVGDINNNGVVDIITTLPSVVGADPNPPRIWVFEWNGIVGENKYGTYNSGTKTYDPSTAWNFDLPANYDFRPYSLIIDDIDKDGGNELIVGVRAANTGSSREIYVVSVQGSFDLFPIWEVEWSYANNFGGSLYNVTTGDLDNDGNKEIYAFVWDNFTMRIFECTGNKQYTEVFAVDGLYAAQGIDYGALDAVRVADVNNDGTKEMYIAGTEPTNKIFIVTGINDVSKMTSADIKELYTIPVTSGGKFRSMYIADPDHDGKTDLMIGGELNGQIFSLEYKGSGNPADSSNWEHRILYDMWNESGLTTISPRLFYGCPAKDMDKDGKDEYVFVNYGPDYSIWADDAPLRIIEIEKAADVELSNNSKPQEFLLMPNYPNPFNPSTVISYQIPVNGHVLLTVYDAIGREVATLVNEIKDAGYYSVTFNASKLSSGTYFTRLQSGSKVQLKKMMLLK
jgi:hypothetical protein